METEGSGPDQPHGDGAAISIDDMYRYLLWRTWDETRPRLLWILLNPSRANAQDNDRTVNRCIHFSREWGYGSLEIVNLFAFRTPSPQNLWSALDPIGSENDCYIDKAVARAKDIIVAWGEHGVYKQRNLEICALLAKYPKRQLDCLGKALNGSPRHPARLARSASRIPFSCGK